MQKKEGVCLDHRHGAEGKEIWGQGFKGGKNWQNWWLMGITNKEN